MREIPLSRGFVALVDDEDYELVSQYRWFAVCGGSDRKGPEQDRRYYAVGYRPGGGRRGPRVQMHRLISGNPVGLVVDHANQNTFDNRRANLRVCTQKQNLGNRKISKRNTSGFTGVGKKTPNGLYRACIAKQYIGSFQTPEEAARAYDSAAIERWGEFARPNFPDEHKAKLTA